MVYSDWQHEAAMPHPIYQQYRYGFYAQGISRGSCCISRPLYRGDSSRVGPPWYSYDSKPFHPFRVGEVALWNSLFGSWAGRVMAIRNYVPSSECADRRDSSMVYSNVGMMILPTAILGPIADDGLRTFASIGSEKIIEPTFYGVGFMFSRITSPVVWNRYLEVEANVDLSPYPFLVKRLQGFLCR